MKKISRYTRMIAALLFAVIISGGVHTFFVGIEKIADSDSHFIYEMERSFNESHYVGRLLGVLPMRFESAYYEIEDEANAGLTAEEKYNHLRNNIAEQMLAFNDELDYYLSINGTEIISNGLTAEEDIEKSAAFSKYYAVNGNGSYNSSGNTSYQYYTGIEDFMYDVLATKDILIMSRVKPELLAELEETWTKQEGAFQVLFFDMIYFIIAALLLLAYLLIRCGRVYGEDKIKLCAIDKIWVEVHAAVIFTVIISSFALMAGFADEDFILHAPRYMVLSAAGGLAFIEAALFETSLLSIVRNLKNHSLLKHSIIAKICSFAWRHGKKLLLWGIEVSQKILQRGYSYVKSGITLVKRGLSVKSAVLYAVMLMAYTFIICLFVIAARSVSGLLAVALVYLAACILLSYRASDLDKIKGGTAEIKNGALDYKISEIKSEDYKQLAENINDIGSGLSRSAEKTLRAERMKTELITNVSHDLKTPLTSIINYTKLLEEMELSPEEAADYVKIISKKSGQLKNLTSDLFEISKVQSGSGEINRERLDAALLISQSIGEHDAEIKKSGLVFCTNIEDGLYIMADGRKMSRVVGNLIGNILKYSMKNTRVFISARAEEGKAVMEFKNISSYPLDFDAGEITERFVRGDKSRSEDGNGLGLAIAKGYTEASGGSFEIITDGDMFKAIIAFDIA